MISDVTELNIEHVRAFLDAHADTTMFLVANLATCGPRLGDSMNSGNFRCIHDGDEIAAVFCLTRRGNLLAESGGRTEFAAEIIEDCAKEPMPTTGVVGEWQLAAALWQLLVDADAFVEEYVSREFLYRLHLSPSSPEAGRFDGVRHLETADFHEWKTLNESYLREEGLPPANASEAEKRAHFEEQARAGHWWGCFEGDRLIAIAALNAATGKSGQLGGVYTVPDRRRRGHSRTLMRCLMADCANVYRFEKLILFTGASNRAAQGLYESLGFARIGEFGLLFGRWRNAEA